MTNDTAAVGKYTRFLFVVSGLSLILVFFFAPIISVDGTYSCFGNRPPYFGYTTWESPSYYLFKIGNRYTSPQVLCP